VPPELAPWLVGLGVVPDWNPARQPWLNPKVERANGVTQRWVEIQTRPDRAALVQRLAWACRPQREWYPAIAGRPRIAVHPEVTRVLRPYSVATEPTRWELGRVDAFLAGRSWRRRADRYWTIWLHNRSHCLGRVHAGKEVRVRFDPNGRHWVVSDADDGPLMRFIAAELNRQRILDLDVSHHRPPRKKNPRSANHQ
jgi:hypothetical protein